MATIKDVVLLYLEDSPVSFARIESIVPDAKKDWYQIQLLMLQIPVQVVTWILRDAYINGEEFHMNGKKMKLELVECPDPPLFVPEDTLENRPNPKEEKETTTGRIISFPGLKNRQKDHGPDPK